MTSAYVSRLAGAYSHTPPLLRVCCRHAHWWQKKTYHSANYGVGSICSHIAFSSEAACFYSDLYLLCSYGKARAGQIPPNSTLVFDVELVNVKWRGLLMKGMRANWGYCASSKNTIFLQQRYSFTCSRYVYLIFSLATKPFGLNFGGVAFAWLASELISVMVMWLVFDILLRSYQDLFRMNEWSVTSFKLSQNFVVVD
jgi:hypothetical protein